MFVHILVYLLPGTRLCVRVEELPLLPQRVLLQFGPWLGLGVWRLDSFPRRLFPPRPRGSVLSLRLPPVQRGHGDSRWGRFHGEGGAGLFLDVGAWRLLAWLLEQRARKVGGVLESWSSFLLVGQRAGKRRDNFIPHAFNCYSQRPSLSLSISTSLIIHTEPYCNQRCVQNDKHRLMFTNSLQFALRFFNTLTNDLRKLLPMGTW